jgi:hypothetical protein
MPATQLDSFLAILAGEPARRVVWTADLSYWMDGQRQAGIAPKAWDTEEGYLELHHDLGVMPYYYYDAFWAAASVYDGSVQWSTKSVGRATRRRVETPAGTLEEEQVYLPESACHAIRHHFVTGPEDLPVLRYLLEHRRLEPANLRDYPERRNLWRRYDGLPCLGLPRSPLPALCTEWAGVEALSYLLLDEPDELRDIVALLEAEQEPILDAVCELAPPVVHMPDNLSSDTFTGLFDEWMALPYRRRLDKLHSAGVRAAVHLDGATRGLLPRLGAVGFDAVEAVTPHPVGDASILEMRELVQAGTLILWGGMPGAMFAPPWTWDDLHAQLKKVLSGWKHTPFVVGVADQVPPDGDVEHCRRIAAALR